MFGGPGVAGALLLVFAITNQTASEVISFQLLHQKNGSAQEAFGFSAAGAGDVNGDGKADFIIGNYRASPGGRFEAGSVYIYSGQDGSLLYQVDSDSIGEWFGYSVSGGEDVNGDGKADFIIGAPHASPNGLLWAGSAYVFSGVDTSLLYRKDGIASRDYFGTAVGRMGDVNSDGKADFIIGATHTDVGEIDAGSAFVYSGADGSLLYRKDGSSRAEYFGLSVSGVGDVNGDGNADFIIGAPNADNGAATSFNSGAAFVYSGRDSSLLFSFEGSKEDDHLGYSVSGVGDINGDGKSDFIVGVPHISNIGLSDTGRAIIYSGADGSALRVLRGDTADDYFGTSVAGTGDVDGDGVGDVAVGAFGAETGGLTQAGAAFVFSGADGALLFQLNGARAYDGMGVPVAGAGDVNGDGYSDFLISAPQADTGRGQVFIYGPIPTAVPGEKGNRPMRFELSQNYPNPFNPTTTIRYFLPARENIRLEIFNLLGGRVKVLADEEQAAGEHSLTWNGADEKGKILPSGIYFYRLKGRGFSESRKMLLLK